MGRVVKGGKIGMNQILLIYNVSVDDRGDVYIIEEKSRSGFLSKYSTTDGSLLWTKQIADYGEDVQEIHLDQFISQLMMIFFQDTTSKMKCLLQLNVDKSGGDARTRGIGLVRRINIRRWSSFKQTSGDQDGH